MPVSRQKEERERHPEPLVTRLETKLNNLAYQAETGKARDKKKVERRIGRLLEQNSRAASLFKVTVPETVTGEDARISMDINKNEERYQWALETGGSYILRTNWTESDPKTLWNTYIQLTEVEDSF